MRKCFNFSASYGKLQRYHYPNPTLLIDVSSFVYVRTHTQTDTRVRTHTHTPFLVNSSSYVRCMHVVTSRVCPRQRRVFWVFFTGFRPTVCYLRFCFDIAEATSGSVAKSVCVCVCVCVRACVRACVCTSVCVCVSWGYSISLPHYFSCYLCCRKSAIEHSTIIFGRRVFEDGMAVHYRQGLWEPVYWIGYWLSMHMYPKILITRGLSLAIFEFWENFPCISFSF